jgi:hypothetical protein
MESSTKRGWDILLPLHQSILRRARKCARVAASFLCVFVYLRVGCGAGAASASPEPELKPAATTAPVARKLAAEAANADLKTARAANQEKRYADAEALMARDRALRQPNIADGFPRAWPHTIDEVSQADFKHVLSGHGPCSRTAPS